LFLLPFLPVVAAFSGALLALAAAALGRGQPDARTFLITITALKGTESGGKPGSEIPPPGKCRRKNCPGVVQTE